jgi:phosphoribosylformylglycinamidine cyclo-ligase
MEKLTYTQSGVAYDLLDAFKRDCQRAALTTVDLLAAHGLVEPSGVRGESAYLLETPNEYLAHVEEGLGTKNVVADVMLERTGRSHYHSIGIDVVAAIVNDLATSGALPISVAMHAAVGDAGWFATGSPGTDLAAGFAEGCRRAGAVWGPGETPVLKDIVTPGTIVLAGSALGRIAPKSRRITGNVNDGDAIVLLASTGIHANGLTLCRSLVDRLPDGYLTPLPDGRMFGETLLDASAIYVPFIRRCQEMDIDLHYAVHITGHGWRKLMRLAEPFVYRIHQLPTDLPIFRFILDSGAVDIREAYATFNMGAGFGVYIASKDVSGCLEAARQTGIPAWHAGEVLKDADRKGVEITPLGISFDAESLDLRG